MTKPPLILGVKCKEWRGGTSLSADLAYQESRKIALKRDKLTCRYCGFQAKKYQETHHINDDHNDNSPDNLLTCCALCHSVHHIGLTGLRKKAVIIYAPDISQAHINRLSMLFFAFRHGLSRGDDFAMKHYAVIEEVEIELSERSSIVTKAFCDEEASDPLWMANMLLSVPASSYVDRGKLLGDLRLLPKHEGWEQENPKRMTYWSELSLRKYEASQSKIVSALSNEEEREAEEAEEAEEA